MQQTKHTNGRPLLPPAAWYLLTAAAVCAFAGLAMVCAGHGRRERAPQTPPQVQVAVPDAAPSRPATPVVAPTPTAEGRTPLAKPAVDNRLLCRRRVAAVRRRPSNSSERVTEALYGHELDVVERREGWLKVSVVDQAGYPGWIEATATCRPPRAAAGASRRWVAAADAFARRAPDDPSPAPGWPRRIAGGSAIFVVEAAGSHVRAVSLSGDEGWLCSDELAPTAGAPGSGGEMVDRAREYVGTPYLWGGMSTDGIDCSGLVWAIHRAAGKPLERDARDQFGQGTEVRRRALQPGDCVFFRTNPDRRGASHVGLYIGDGEVIHASSARGVVADRLDGAYLSRRYLGARRM